MSNMSNDGFGHERYYRPYLVDQGSGARFVQYKAWRIDRPNVSGYGMTLDDAIEDLVKNVAPSSAIRRSALVNLSGMRHQMRGNVDNVVEEGYDNMINRGKFTDLKYCIRTKHSRDMPLKNPRKNCAFRRGDECTWHPATLEYCKENGIDTDYGIRFKCVLAEV